jgi:error-prone DNA polymerase
MLAGSAPPEGLPMLRRPGEGEEVAADYNSMGLSLRRHPLALLRPQLSSRGLLTAADVQSARADSLVHACGLVITRQRPGSAAGVVFVTLEDETGYLNLIIWERLARRQRRVLLGASLMGLWGKVQRQGEVLHLIAQRLEDHSNLLGELRGESRDFR